jgi:hypothetical protein
MDKPTPARRGRPAATAPTMPMFLGAARSRVKEEIVMSVPTSHEFRSYVAWASGVAMMPQDEVRIRTVDHALAEYFRKDAAWQAGRGDYLRAAGAQSDAGSKAAPAPAAASPRPPEKTEARPFNSGTGAVAAALPAPRVG